MDVTYIGHSAFSIETDAGSRILIDPWIDENPHTDARAEEMDADQIFITHAAHDHLGDAPAIAERTGAEILCDSATAMKLEHEGFPEEQLQPYIWGPDYEKDDWSVRILEAHHQSSVPELNLIGEALAFLLRADGERVYHMGDTSITRDFELFGDLHDPTVLLVPVGEAIDQFVELHPDEAALVTEWIDPEVAVPIHYRPGSANPQAYADHCADRGLDTDVRLLQPGETLDR